MTDLEVSYQLALAIGYEKHSVGPSFPDGIAVYHSSGPKSSGEGWWQFDYTDPAVIWPIAKHYKCFPYHSQFDRPGRQWSAVLGGKVYEADTPEMAVALAVIGGSK